MHILTIDTATVRLEVSLTTHDGSYYQYAICAGLQHTERLVPAIDSILADANISPRSIDLIVCAQGPGSFTGLRIGMSTAKGLADAVGTPVVSIPTLDAMVAEFSWYPEVVVPVLDARKQRVYAALFTHGTRETGDLDVPADHLADLVKNRSPLLIGADRQFVDEIAARIPGSRVHIPGGSGRSYAALGRQRLESHGPDPKDAGPLYLRRSDAETAALQQGGC